MNNADLTNAINEDRGFIDLIGFAWCQTVSLFSAYGFK
jgi:hypothetical protein